MLLKPIILISLRVVCVENIVASENSRGLGYDDTTARKKLKSFLPKYMIPTSLKKLDAMPLTPNGKLDRKLMKNIMEEEA